MGPVSGGICGAAEGGAAEDGGDIPPPGLGGVRDLQKDGGAHTPARAGRRPGFAEGRRSTYPRPD
jgi:hypothetical protein